MSGLSQSPARVEASHVYYAPHRKCPANAQDLMLEGSTRRHWVPVTMSAIASIRHRARSYRPQGTNAVGNGARSDRAHPYAALAVEI